MKYANIVNNPIRRLSIFIYNYFKLENINFKKYHIIHSIYIFLIIFIVLFNTNLFHLIILLIMMSLDAFSIVVFHKCPLTLLERKHLNINSYKERKKFIKNTGILYKCNHEYEEQLELLINVWMLITSKCLIIIFLKMFNFKITNNHNLYNNE